MSVREWKCRVAARKFPPIAVAALACVALAGPGVVSARKSASIAPQCGNVYGGKICVGGTTRGGEIRSITATVPLRVIESAPSTMEMKWPPQSALVLPLPAQIRTALGVDHLTFYWEAMGHPPGPFMTPHFDFHFYVVNDAAREAIDCKNEKKAEQLPAGYSLRDAEVPGIGVLKGLCVPLMGMHALREADSKGSGPFKSTMVLGYYGDKPIFFEPMISRAVLLHKANISLAVPPLAALPPDVHYPSRFSARYDRSIRAYRFEFTGFR